MAEKREVVFVSAVRTAIGDYGGTLKDFSPSDLATRVVKEAIARGKVDVAQIGHLVLGNVIHTEQRDMYVSRVAALNAGLTKESCALTLNRLCGSGFQAVITAANAIQLGDTDAAVAGGVESMSRAGYLMPAARWGARMGDAKILDMMVGALTDPFETVHMGITAENVAAKFGISRDEQDAFAVESHKRAARATEAGHFKDQILPVEISSKKGTVQFVADEHIRGDASVEGMAKLKTAFKKEGGSVTAGNASGINDGAAAVVLMEASAAAKAGLKPLARLVSYGVAGVDPSIMGTGPIPAVQLALKRAGLKASDLDVIESNEAFAAQALCVTKGLDLDPAKVNPNGGAVALGHPLGATGAILTVKCLYELQRTGKKYGLITMCIGGGQGIAGVVERL
ncbi:MAG TPA: acetyl-CoA C-acyltransferase family protein [Rhodocyclaceae bacterium]|nr:acetyl-CoA C-acyltransferase family protein [Rhodocyclaceae bacterium]HMV52988.1 acetyl-CoA C-acyltransferase family protein [Rhodocyclaceae bacterium]HNA02353.1 acetyl-CoA C-acyltransferase family protein [Rhodocyclaceae bacterium]HNB79282.1 acetyl-CoA C-acyltransferase family protein [Rhodocyclaceae bacterium]HNC61415.1 acetyl-CoA C-acyltransferase family protein [Rhodocyclaceae bacterium]